MVTTSSLPNEKKTDRANNTNKLLNRYYNQEIYYTPSEVDAVVGYFLKVLMMFNLVMLSHRY